MGVWMREILSRPLDLWVDALHSHVGWSLPRCDPGAAGVCLWGKETRVYVSDGEGVH